MDIIDNLIFTTLNSVALNHHHTTFDGVGRSIPAILDNAEYYGDIPDTFQKNRTPNQISIGNPSIYSYRNNNLASQPISHLREDYVAFEDTSIIEKAIQKHWFDLVNHRSYSSSGPSPKFFNTFNSTTPPPLITLFMPIYLKTPELLRYLKN